MTGNDRLGARVWAAWQRFWFAAVDPTGLHAIRALSCLLFVFWLAPLAGDYGAFFGLGGWFDRDAFVDASQSAPFPIGWSIAFLFGDLPMITYAFSLASFVLFGLGVATRITGVFTWVCVVSHLANPALHYDADWLLAILAFYLMVAYLLLGQLSGGLTTVERIVGPGGAWLSPWRTTPHAPSFAARFVLRLMQVHFAIVVVTSALHKLQYADWWAGASFWYWMNPPESITALSIRDMRSSANASLVFISLATYVTLAWQFAFPAIAFARQTRWLLLSGAAVAWLANSWLFDWPFFGALFFVVCLTYLTPEEWTAWFARIRGLRTAAPTAPEKPKFRPRTAP